VTVLVDTCVWSIVLRRRQPSHNAVGEELRRLIASGQASIIGAVRQELLAGISDRSIFEMLRERLRAYVDITPARQDYELAAEFFNACRQRGVQSSPTDMLLCAVAARQEMSIFSTDRDFERYSKIIQVRLHSVPKSNV